MSGKDAAQRFFSTLHQVGSEIAGAESAVALAAKDAIHDPTPVAMVRAQEELARLSDEQRDKILRDVHARLRTDIEAIWENLPNAPKPGRPN